jgi:hypothetical protein
VLDNVIISQLPLLVGRDSVEVWLRHFTVCLKRQRLVRQAHHRRFGFVLWRYDTKLLKMVQLARQGTGPAHQPDKHQLDRWNKSKAVLITGRLGTHLPQ